jgi:hypothetical protein
LPRHRSNLTIIAAGHVEFARNASDQFVIHRDELMLTVPDPAQGKITHGVKSVFSRPMTEGIAGIAFAREVGHDVAGDQIEQDEG